MRVLFASGIDGFCHRYAVLHWAEELATQGIAATVRAHTDPRLAADLADHDVFVLYRVPDGAWVRHLIAEARASGLATVFAVDDLIVDPALSDPPPVRRMDEAERCLWHEGVARYRRTMLACDAFLATTAPLADAGRGAGIPSFVHRCGLSAREVALGEAAQRIRRPLAAPRLGYFSGTATHDEDFATIAPALRNVLARDARVTLAVTGPVTIDPVLATFAARIERLPLVPWPQLPARIAAVDVSLAPLAWRDPFVAAKGAVKYLEASSVGVPTVASPTEAFRHATRDGATGVLATDAHEWEAALTHLVDDVEDRARLGRAASADVAARFTPAVQGAELRAILDAVRERRAAATRPPGGERREASGGRAEREPIRSAGDHTVAADEVALARRFPGEVTYAAREPSALPDRLLTAATTTPPLVDGVVLSQRVRPRLAGLARVDVQTVTYGLALDHGLEMRLRRDDGSIAASRTMPAALAPDRDWVALELPPEADSAERGYVLELRARGTGTRNALSFGATETPGEDGGYTLGNAAAAGSLAVRTFVLAEAPTPRRACRA